jgi:hypothetical protein
VLIAGLPLAAAAQEKSTGDQLDEVLENVLDAIGMVLQAVPQYELPEVLPNGDIIIRRVPPLEPPEGKPEEEPENTDEGVKT